MIKKRPHVSRLPEKQASPCEVQLTDKLFNMKQGTSLYDKAVATYKTGGLRGLCRKGWNKAEYNVRQLTFRPYMIKKSICGEVVDLLIADLCAKAWYDRIHEWPELVWLKEHILNENDIIVDCGVHHGLTAILFSRWALAGKVFGYEAHPKNAEIARINLINNRADNAQLTQAAVGNYVGSTKISNHSNSSILERAYTDGIEVPLVTLDSEFTSQTPTFIKIDVEGQELNVLKGANRILQTRPKLDIEIHCILREDPIREVKEIFDLIVIEEYQAFVQLDVDGAIQKFDPKLHTAIYISQHEVVHLFCVPK